MASINIPVVDISDSNPNAAKELLSAASNNGFVYIENNEAGIDVKIIHEAFKLSRDFFSLPLEVKEQAAISSNAAGSNVGWLRQGVEKLDPAVQQKPDVKEYAKPELCVTVLTKSRALNIPVPLSKSPRVPEAIKPHAQLINDFQKACQALCLRILDSFATALSIDADWFTSRHDRPLKGLSGTILRMLYYPSLATSTTLPGDDSITTEDVRAGAHSDYGSITLLFQQPGQPGLEIKDIDDSWSSVPIDPAGSLSKGKPLPILVNIGDLLEDWTAGLLKSTVHRVVFPADARQHGDRYSMAYFCHPLDEALLEPVPSPLIKDRVQENGNGQYITAKQHLTNRLAATYTIET